MFFQGKETRTKTVRAKTGDFVVSGGISCLLSDIFCLYVIYQKKEQRTKTMKWLHQSFIFALFV